MRNILISAAAAAAAIAAAPAVAQPGYGHQGYGHGNQGYGHQDHGYDRRGQGRQAIHQLERELQQIEQRIYRAAERGRISRREASGLFGEVGRIRTQLDRASYRGLSGREYGHIRSRIQQLRHRIREERHDYDGRRDRRGW